MAKDVIEKILNREKAGESALAAAEAEANKIIADAKTKAERLLSVAKQEATDTVTQKMADANKAKAELTNQYEDKAKTEIEKIGANAAAKEAEALNALTELILGRSVQTRLK